MSCTGSFLHSPLLDELRALEAILALDSTDAAEAACSAAAAEGAAPPAADDPLLVGPAAARPNLALVEEGVTSRPQGQASSRRVVREEPVKKGLRKGAVRGVLLALPRLASLVRVVQEVIEGESRADALQQSTGGGDASCTRAGSGGGDDCRCGASEQSSSTMGADVGRPSVSLASTSSGVIEEADEDYLCPICLARSPLWHTPYVLCDLLLHSMVVCARNNVM